VATLAVTRRLNLTDEQWARLEPLSTIHSCRCSHRGRGRTWTTPPALRPPLNLRKRIRRSRVRLWELRGAAPYPRPSLGDGDQSGIISSPGQAEPYPEPLGAARASLRAVASHAIGLADPRPGDH